MASLFPRALAGRHAAGRRVQIRRIPRAGWPGRIAPGINPEPIISHDLFPTLLSLVGIESPAGHTVNGQDLSPLLAGEAFERREPLVFHYPHWHPAGSPHSAVRDGDWKLIYNYKDASWELYTLAKDIGETTNLIATGQDHHTDARVLRRHMGCGLPIRRGARHAEIGGL